MTDLVLIVRLAGRRIAIPADCVEAVVELERFTPVPRAAPHVAGLSALRSRVVTVIDPLVVLGFDATPQRPLYEAVLVSWEGHPYGLLVDSVEDVVEAPVARAATGTPFGAGWSDIATGLVEASGELLLLVDPYRLIAGQNARAA